MVLCVGAEGGVCWEMHPWSPIPVSKLVTETHSALGKGSGGLSPFGPCCRKPPHELPSASRHDCCHPSQGWLEYEGQQGVMGDW